MKGWIVLVSLVLALPASADFSEQLAKKLPRANWSLLKTHGHKHTSYAFTFAEGGRGGVYSMAINGQRLAYPFASYRFVRLDQDWLRQVVNENHFKFNPSNVRAVIVTYNSEREPVTYLFAVGSDCLLAPFLVGSTEDMCLSQRPR